MSASREPLDGPCAGRGEGMGEEVGVRIWGEGLGADKGGLLVVKELELGFEVRGGEREGRGRRKR